MNTASSWKFHTACTHKPLSRGFFKFLIATTIALASPALCRANNNELYIQAGSFGYNDGFHNTASTTDPNASSLTTGYTGPDGSAHATVGYGSMSLNSHSVNGGTYYGSYYPSSGHWLDTITISDPTLNGMSGTARFTYSFSGSFSAADITGLTAGGWDLSLDPNTGWSYAIGSGGTDISTLHTLSDDIGFTFGTPFQIQVSMDAHAMTAYSANDATMDVTMSIQETGLTVLSGGNPLNTSSYSTSSTSGTNYAQPVPEPDTWVALACGAGLLTLRRRRGR